jgi:hypothetical protein
MLILFLASGSSCQVIFSKSNKNSIKKDSTFLLDGIFFWSGCGAHLTEQAGFSNRRFFICGSETAAPYFSGILSSVATRKSQNFCTVAMFTFSSGECGKRMVGPNEIYPGAGNFRQGFHIPNRREWN